MAHIQQKKQNDSKNTFGLIAAGAVVAAGVAVAATLAIKDKKSQEKVKKLLTDVRDGTQESIEKLKKNSNIRQGMQKGEEVVATIKKK